jgi:hypothetical protein
MMSKTQSVDEERKSKVNRRRKGLNKIKIKIRIKKMAFSE